MSDFGQVVAAPEGRFDGIERPYGVEDVLKLRGSIPIEHTLARRGALKLWELLHRRRARPRARRLSGNQAMQMVRAGLQAIYLSGWQVAADSNVSGSMYPDQSLYPGQFGPRARQEDQQDARRAPTRSSISKAARNATGSRRSSPMPRPASAGRSNCFEIMKAYIEAGAAGVHFEDQLAARRSAATWAARC